MTKELANELKELVRKSLNEAEDTWAKVSVLMEKTSAALLRRLPSEIPGHEFVTQGEPKVDNFIAMVVDLRDSTGHLLNAISARITDVNQLQRVFYETSALLPVTARVIREHGGKTTEYLGDGALGLFQVAKTDEGLENSIKKAYDASTDCIEATKTILNTELKNRYSLPPIEIGIGLAYSQAIVTIVGSSEFRQPKAFGECVFRASKLCKRSNQVCVDTMIDSNWPRSKGGTLITKSIKLNDVDGWIVNPE